ncbi:MAG: hypothetical protein PHU25_17970 [Deltaproteobacteria bacterium]|nr:hypothetical protein [Deltaproteobacteria bacterium]
MRTPPTPTYEELIRDIPEDIVAASREVDRTLIRWLLSLPPLERVAWSMRTAAALQAFRRVER